MNNDLDYLLLLAMRIVRATIPFDFTHAFTMPDEGLWLQLISLTEN
jgi:hypothetical protein